VSGYAYSTEATFPVTTGSDLTHNGDSDAFVAKIFYLAPSGHKHGVGDLDGDGSAEVAVDFGARSSLFSFAWSSSPRPWWRRSKASATRTFQFPSI